MSKHIALERVHAPIGHGWRLPALIALGAAASLAAGLACCWGHFQDVSPGSFRASAALVILLAAMVQFRSAWRLWQVRSVTRRTTGISPRSFLKAMLVGVVGAYVLALALGPVPGIREIFFAAVVAWYSLLLLPLSAQGETVQSWHRLAERRLPRSSARGAYWLALLAVNAELSARVWQWISVDRSLGVQASAMGPLSGAAMADERATLPPDHTLGDPWQPGQLRLTVLGNESTISGSAPMNHLAQLESMLPGVRVANCGTAQVPAEYVAHLENEAARLRPDVVLVFVSVGSDITAEANTKSPFDWRVLGLSKLVAGHVQKRPETDAATPHDDDHEFLRAQGTQLAICRTPIDERMQRCWKQTFSHLAELAAGCRRDDLSMALVIVPAEFQVSRNLCDTLGRRQGLARKDLDLELPQRRLSAFAEQQGIPVVDLLPSLRQSEEPPYLRNSGQWSPKGHAIAARALGGWLQSRYGAQIAANAQLTIRR